MTISNGLTQIYPDTSAPLKDTQVDIVAVHGLNPRGDQDHAFNTWRSPKGTDGKLWLRDFLPSQTPHARILIYRYDSQPAFSKTRTNFVEQANDLLERIRIKRKHCPDRPILFVAHSLGGILVKQALVNAHNNSAYTPIQKSTCGLMFFGTPHGGGNNFEVSLGEASAKVVRRLYASPPRDLMQALKSGSLYSEYLKEMWRHQLNLYKIVSFYETIGEVVSKDSATIGLPGDNETILPISADHSGMCKFALEDDNCEIVMANLVDLYENAQQRSETLVETFELPNVPTSTLGSIADSSDPHRVLETLSTLSRTSSVMSMHSLNTLAVVNKVLQRPELGELIFDQTSSRYMLFEYQKFFEAEVRNISGTTCSWISSAPTYTKWQGGTRPCVLWMEGSPGVGKTVLATYVVQQLLSSTTENAPQDTMTLFSFYHRRYNTTGSTILCTLIHQVLSRLPHLRCYAYALGGSATNRPSQCSVQQLIHLLKVLIQLAKSHVKKIFIVIDGLDFTKPKSRKTFLQELGCVAVNTKIMLVTRDRGVLQTNFTVQCMNSHPSGYHIHLDNDAQSEIGYDIKSFIRHELAHPSYSILDAKQKSSIENNLRGATSFLWTRLAIERLRPRTSAVATNTTPPYVPTGLTEIIKFLVEELRSLEDEFSRQILVHVLHSYDPFTFKELRFACERPTPNSQVPAKPFRQRLEAIRPLITIQPVTGQVQLFHEALREPLCSYLSSLRVTDVLFLAAGDAETEMAVNCLTRLRVSSDLDFPPLSAGIKVNYKHLLDSFLAKHLTLGYAFKFWHKHLQKALETCHTPRDVPDELRDGVQFIVDVWRNRDGGLFRHLMISLTRIDHMDSKMTLSRFELFCALGLAVFVQEILDNESQKRTSEHQIERALMLAIKGGHASLAQMLIERYNVTSLDDAIFEGAIASAIQYGQEDMVEVILNMRKITPGEMREAGVAAFTTGQRGALEVLQKHGAFQDREEWNTSVLHHEFVFGWGREAIDSLPARIKFLVESESVDVDAKENIFGNTALHLACWYGYPSTIIRTLLEVGAAADAENTFMWAPIHLAATYSRDVGTVQYLLDATGNAAVGLLTRGGNSPLHWAAQPTRAGSERYEIVRVLLEAGADPKLPNREGQTPLQVASWGCLSAFQQAYTRFDGITHQGPSTQLALQRRAYPVSQGENEAEQDLEYVRLFTSQDFRAQSFGSTVEMESKTVPKCTGIPNKASRDATAVEFIAVSNKPSGDTTAAPSILRKVLQKLQQAFGR